MAEKPNGVDIRIERTMNMIRDYVERLSEMSSDEMIVELRCLTESKGDLERELSDVDLKMISIKAMPDVAEYIVGRTPIAVALLNDLRDMVENPSYIELAKSYSDPKGILFPHSLELLKTAGLVEMQVDPSNEYDRIITLTERGQTVDYTAIS